MTKRCLLHLGMPKTASTSIQVALHNNRALLKKKGWEYPVFKCPQHGYAFSNHNDPLCRLFAPGHPFHVQRPVKNGIIDLEIQQKGLFEELDFFCRNSSRIILSSETLLGLAPLKRIQTYMHSQGYDIEPIIYVRSPYTYRVSLYQSFLKFSQFPAAEIIKRLQKPIVKASLEASMKIFGDTVKFYPFTHLVRSGVDVVKHFFAHILDEKDCDLIIINKVNESISRQAISLLEYIEEKNPIYIDNVKSIDRGQGDIYPLHRLAGEKFWFNPEQFSLVSEVVDMENKWLLENMGKEFCDGDYLNQVVTEPLIWKEESVQSLAKIFSRLPRNIQDIIGSYMEERAIFAFPALKRRMSRSIRKKIKLHNQTWNFFRIMKFFPPRSKRRKLVEKLFKPFTD